MDNQQDPESIKQSKHSSKEIPLSRKETPFTLITLHPDQMRFLQHRFRSLEKTIQENEAHDKTLFPSPYTIGGHSPIICTYITLSIQNSPQFTELSIHISGVELRWLRYKLIIRNEEGQN